MRRLTAFAVVLLAAAALTGCGKAGRPLAPEGSTYPNTYPKQQGQPTPAKQKDENRALPPEWDPQDLKDAGTRQGAFIDPSARQPMSSIQNFIQHNIAPRTTIGGSGGVNQGVGDAGSSPAGLPE